MIDVTFGSTLAIMTMIDTFSLLSFESIVVAA